MSLKVQSQFFDGDILNDMRTSLSEKFCCKLLLCTEKSFEGRRKFIGLKFIGLKFIGLHFVGFNFIGHTHKFIGGKKVGI